MFKRNIFGYILAACFTFLLFLTGCSGANPIVSVSITGNSEETPITFVVGEFSYEGIEIAVSYKDGETKAVPLTEEMINPDDLIKFYKLGKNEIEVVYEKEKTNLYIYGTYKQFKDIYLNDVTTTYTGEVIKVELQGNIPATAQVIYPKGNTYKDAGEYETVAIIYENGYEVLELKADVVINKAIYDMSNVKLKDKTVTYDGTEKSILIQGELPEGVEVNYTIDGNHVSSVKESGTYEVVASFVGDNRNYEKIEPMSATLTINKAKYNMDGIVLEDKEVVYDTFSHNLVLKNEDLLPSGVTAVYKNNSNVNAGTYEVIVEFEIEDTKNYEAIQPMKATLTINKAEYDFGDISLLSQQVEYEHGKTYQLSLSEEVPSFVEAEYYYYPQENEGIYKLLYIDASEGYWYSDGEGYVNVGVGTTLTIKLNGRTNISIVAKESADNFQVEVVDDTAVITCLKEDAISSITVTNPNDELDTLTTDVSLCDVIFHNKDNPLKAGILPSLKGEYIVVVKLVVNDDNYYGEIEETAFLIIE